jgi:putative sterol carrier protein
MSDITVQELMNRMPRAFRPDAAAGVNTVLQYHLTGDEGGDWIVTIQDGQCSVVEGVAENPNMTLSANAQDYKDVITGKTNAMQAFMTGKVKLAGDLALAMKLPNFFQMG